MARFAVAMLDGCHELSDALSPIKMVDERGCTILFCSSVAVDRTDFDAQQPASIVPMCLNTRLNLSFSQTYTDPISLGINMANIAGSGRSPRPNSNAAIIFLRTFSGQSQCKAWREAAIQGDTTAGCILLGVDVLEVRHCPINVGGVAQGREKGGWRLVATA